MVSRWLPQRLVEAAIIILLLVLPSFSAGAQETSQSPSLSPSPSASSTIAAGMNNNTVGIISGKSDSAYLAAVEDLSAVLDDGEKLRIIAMLGKGALQNVRDILYLKNTDMGVTHANVLKYLARSGELGQSITSRIRYISKLFNEEVHIVAGKDVAALRALEGRQVNFGERGSGTQLTAELVFEALGIKVKPVYMIQSDALVAIKKDRIAAIVLVAGKPSPLLARFRFDGKFKLLPVPYDEELETDYLPTRFSAKDYPGLLEAGQSVDTVAVPAVLAVFNWRQGSDRYRRVKLFVDAFFSKFDAFRREPRHPKWREVNLNSKVAGWRRFEAAQEWLDKNATTIVTGALRQAPRRATTVAAQRKAFDSFIAKKSQTGEVKEREALFRQFLSWMNQSVGANSARPGAAAAPATTGSTRPPSTGKRLW